MKERERKRDGRLAKTGSQGKGSRGSGRGGRGGQRRIKERTRARRESPAGRGNRLGRQVGAARCEKIRRDR